MENEVTRSAFITGSHVTASPSGSLLACIAENELKICFSTAPERCITFPIRLDQGHVRGIRWSEDSARVLVFSRTIVEVIDLEDEKYRIRLDNGSGGFGHFTSADFVQVDRILTVWEFGKAQLWNLSSGSSIELDHFKTTGDGIRWQMRPGISNAVLAYLTRIGADDALVLQFLNSSVRLPPIKLSTVDARSISWSPDGNWLAILDSPRICTNLHLYTSDGHFFRSFPGKTTLDESSTALGVKAVKWSPDSSHLALAYHDGRIEVLASKTFSLATVFKHNRSISTSSTNGADRLRRWQENVSAFLVRSYAALNLPITPPISRTHATAEAHELGVADFSFSASGRYIVSYEESMLSTVLVWDLYNLRLSTIVIQYSNVRRTAWHGSQSLLLIDCGDDTVHLLDVDERTPPTCIDLKLTVSSNLSFLTGSAVIGKTIVLAASKDGFLLVYADGRPENDFSDGDQQAEDSIFQILSGLNGGASIAELSHTQRLEMEAGAMSEDDTLQPNDTFDGRRARLDLSRDPLDDSDIF